jgi:hypothetical protein
MKHVDLIAPKLDQVIGYHLARASILTTAVFDRAVGQPLALRKVEYTLLALIGDGGATPAGLALEQPAASAPTTVPTHDNAGDTA